jgi:hypothetical protein
MVSGFLPLELGEFRKPRIQLLIFLAETDLFLCVTEMVISG